MKANILPGKAFPSWGRYPQSSQTAQQVFWRGSGWVTPNPAGPVLCYGLGRSYGDVCQNDGGALLVTSGLDRFIAFDAETGVLRCEAGVTLSEALALTVPRGWFFPVLPGTAMVTVGGAIANDIHGKNHHRQGSFGNHLRSLGLRRSDGASLVCNEQANQDLFAATIGGLGLTGMIEWAELQLTRVSSGWVDAEYIRYDNLDDFFRLSEESARDFEYLVAWVDSSARGAALGRGILTRGNHRMNSPDNQHNSGKRSRLGLPFDLPSGLLNPWTIRTLNAAYFQSRPAGLSKEPVHFERFFSPLDGIRNWNRAYGKKGFLQWHCLVPPAAAHDAIREILRQLLAASQASFVSVMKVMGLTPSRGLMSFAGPGVTLALDFPMSASIFTVLDRLDDCVMEAGGRIYLAKDARLSPAAFRRCYPDWARLEEFRDPAFSSSLWRRVTGAAA